MVVASRLIPLSGSVGVEGPPFRFVVEEGKVREYARAIGMTASGVPATFMSTAGRLWGYTFDEPAGTALADVDIDRSLLLHAEEEVEFPLGPPRVGEELTAQTRIADVRRKEGKRGGAMTFVTIETSFHSKGGTLVAVQRQTVVKTEQAPGAA